jgi:hypothetical protein
MPSDLFWTVAISAALAGCGAAASNDGPSPSGAGGTGAVQASGGSGSKAGSGGSAAAASGGGLNIDDAGTDAPDLTPDAACAAETFQAEPAPLNLMVMLDRSCSMTEPQSDPLWDRAKNGMQKFFQDPATDGVGVALGYFPTPDSTDVEYCAGDESKPTVPLAKLSKDPAPADVHEQALLDSMDAQTFSFAGTPLFYALYGALAYATNFATATPDEQIVVVLVTDGIPGESCDYMKNNNIPKIAELAKFAHDGDPSITTFAIGPQGSQEEDMKAIATAGGGEAFFLGSSPNVQQDIFDKLESIQQNNLGCTFKLPESTPGKEADPSKVNVKLISGGGETPFFKVDGPAACVPDGWYYQGSKIKLCPAACQNVKKAADGQVQVLLGCASIKPK